MIPPMTLQYFPPNKSPYSIGKKRNATCFRTCFILSNEQTSFPCWKWCVIASTLLYGLWKRWSKYLYDIWSWRCPFDVLFCSLSFSTERLSSARSGQLCIFLKPSAKPQWLVRMRMFQNWRVCSSCSSLNSPLEMRSIKRREYAVLLCKTEIILEKSRAINF